VIAYSTGVTAWNSYKGTTNAKPNFMYNQQVLYSTDHWTYTPVKFWPNDFSTGNVDNKQGEAGEDYNATGSAAAGKVSFFAYAPYVPIQSYSATPATDLGATVNSAFKTYVSSANPTDGIVAISSNAYKNEPQVKYVISNAALSNAVDLLWGTRGNTTGYNLADGTKSSDGSNAYNTDLTKQSVDEKVDFLFKHALAKIGGHTYETSGQTGLQVVLDLDNGSQNGSVSPSTAISGGVKENNTLVTIESITIQDLYTYNSSSSDLINSGWFNIATGEWSENTATGATYSSTVDNDDTEASEKWEMNAAIKEPTTKTGMTGSASGWTTDGSTSITGVTTEPQDVYTTSSNAPGLLLIPSSTQDQTLVVTIKYIVRTFDDHLAGNDDGATGGTWTKEEQTITNKVTIPAGSLKSNKFYKLLMHLGLTSVKFTANVENWEQSGDTGDNNDDDNNKEIYLPSNTISTSTSVSAGGTATPNVSKASQTYILNLTGATDSHAYTATVSGATGATITPSSGTFSGATQQFVVSIPENTGAERSITVTITDTTSDPNEVTTVTITQAAGV
jgi:hypothetical protein